MEARRSCHTHTLKQSTSPQLPSLETIMSVVKCQESLFDSACRVLFSSQGRIYLCPFEGSTDLEERGSYQFKYTTNDII